MLAFRLVKWLTWEIWTCWLINTDLAWALHVTNVGEDNSGAVAITWNWRALVDTWELDTLWAARTLLVFKVEPSGLPLQTFGSV